MAFTIMFFRLVAGVSIRVHKWSNTKFRELRQKRKIKRRLKLHKPKRLTTEQRDLVKTYYRTQFGIKNVDVRWHQLCTASNGQFSTGYLPEDLFYIQLEPKLNNRDLSYALGDKNLLDKLFPMAKQPETVVKCINGFFYIRGKMCSRAEAIEHCASETGQLVIKPALGSYGGKNVNKFTVSDGKAMPDGIGLEKLFAAYGNNFIVQKAVVQHKAMAALNESSLNTFRLTSYLNENGVSVLSATVRMGRKGSLTDNTSQGGFGCGLTENGQLNKEGYLLDGNKCNATDSGLPFKDIILPHVDKVFEMTRTLHRQAPHFRLIAWDLCLDSNDDVVLIEYNIQGQDVVMHQLNNGPVFSPILENLKP
jgi:hypothetical protein